MIVGSNDAALAVASSRSGVGEMLARSESVDVDHQSLHIDYGISVRGGASGAQGFENAGPEHNPLSAP